MVNFSDISRKIAEEKGIPNKQVRRILGRAFDIIAEETMSGETVFISGFGKFIPQLKSRRVAHNLEHELIEVPEQIKPTFLPSEKFKRRCGNEDPD